METIDILQSILEKISDLQISFINMQDSAKDRGHSMSNAELYAALAKAQGEMEVAQFNKENSYFKSGYSDLRAVIATSRPALSKNGLAVMQKIVADEKGISMLYTMLVHSSGQSIESSVRIIPAKNDIHSYASQVTYLKRICYAALIGVITGEDDDDGEAAMKEVREQEAKGTEHHYDATKESQETITKDQLEELEYELDPFPDIAETLKRQLHLRELADLPKTLYRSTIEKIRHVKASRSGKN